MLRPIDFPRLQDMTVVLSLSNFPLDLLITSVAIAMHRKENPVLTPTQIRDILAEIQTKHLNKIQNIITTEKGI